MPYRKCIESRTQLKSFISLKSFQVSLNQAQPFVFDMFIVVLIWYIKIIFKRAHISFNFKVILFMKNSGPKLLWLKPLKVLIKETNHWLSKEVQQDGHGVAGGVKEKVIFRQ